MFLTIKNEDGSLPDKGWIHTCIFCYNPTSIMEKIYIYNAYICGQCGKKYRKLSKLKYIKDNYELWHEIDN